VVSRHSEVGPIGDGGKTVTEGDGAKAPASGSHRRALMGRDTLQIPQAPNSTEKKLSMAMLGSAFAKER